MRNKEFDVIITRKRHEELLKKEELWDKYKDEHAYAGMFATTVRTSWGSSKDLGHLLMSINEEYTPNTPAEVIAKIDKETIFLRGKIEEMEEENKKVFKDFVEEMRNKYKNIPRWIVKLFT